MDKMLQANDNIYRVNNEAYNVIDYLFSFDDSFYRDVVNNQFRKSFIVHTK